MVRKKVDNSTIDIAKDRALTIIEEAISKKGSDGVVTIAPSKIQSQMVLFDSPMISDIMEGLTVMDDESVELLRRQRDHPLLNRIKLGIEGNAMTYKVIKAIELLLYRQSHALGQTDQNTGAGSLLPGSNKVPQGTKYKEGTPCPVIVTTTRDLCCEVLGTDNPGKLNREAVIKELYRLERGEFAFKVGNSICVTGMLNTSLFISKKGVALSIEMRPMFLRCAGEAFIRDRSDILRLMSGEHNTMTFLLHELLVMAFSKGRVGNKVYSIAKSNMMDRIVRITKYEDHPGLQEKDFKHAVEVMKRIRLVKKYEEVEKMRVMSIFTLNENYLEEDIEKEEGGKEEQA